MSLALDIRIGADGSLDRLQRQTAAMPAAVDRARRGAIAKFAPWLRREVLREAAQAAGTSQKVLKVLLRYQTTLREDSIRIWIGTNEIQAHHLGTVRWSRRMQGARVGRRLFEGAWSWGNSRRMAGLVVERMGDQRLPVQVVTVPIHDAILRRIQELEPEIDARFERILLQELNHALTVEVARA